MSKLVHIQLELSKRVIQRSKVLQTFEKEADFSLVLESNIITYNFK